MHEKGVPEDNIHLVGLSLGSHLAGYIGKEVPGIGRITGQDGWRRLGEFGLGDELSDCTASALRSQSERVCLFVCCASEIYGNVFIRTIAHSCVYVFHCRQCCVIFCFF